MDSIQVILVDDHILPRAGIRTLLQSMAGIEVVGEASNGREALALMGRQPPHVVITDIRMPVMDGFDLTVAVREQFPNVQVLVLSMHTTEEYIWRAMRCGARGYLFKDAPPSELEAAIRKVAQGEPYMAPQVLSRYLSYLERQSPLDQLTPRQLEILKMIAEGKSNKQIAAALGIGGKTVEAHRAQLMDRLRIHDVAGLVRFAIRFGLVSPDS